MAIDVYLQIDGIKGESADSAHQSWIEVSSAQWGVTQPRSATASTAGGHTAERCEHRPLSLTKLADLSSPVLMQTCSMGKTLPKAKLEFMRADGDGTRVKYYEVELENVIIASMDQLVSDGHPTKDRWRRWRQHRWRLGPRLQQVRVIGEDSWSRQSTTRYALSKIRVRSSCCRNRRWTQATTPMASSTGSRTGERTNTLIRS